MPDLVIGDHINTYLSLSKGLVVSVIRVIKLFASLHELPILTSKLLIEVKGKHCAL